MHSVNRTLGGRALAAKRVMADLRMREVAAAMGVSKSRVNCIEHLDHVTAATAARYSEAVRTAAIRGRTR